MTLPFLPPSKWKDALDWMDEEVNKIRPINQGVLVFKTYINQTWAPISSYVSVFKNINRSNNVCENYHKRILHDVGKHEGLWRMQSNFNYH